MFNTLDRSIESACKAYAHRTAVQAKVAADKRKAAELEKAYADASDAWDDHLAYVAEHGPYGRGQ